MDKLSHQDNCSIISYTKDVNLGAAKRQFIFLPNKLQSETSKLSRTLYIYRKMSECRSINDSHFRTIQDNRPSEPFLIGTG